MSVGRPIKLTCRKQIERHAKGHCIYCDTDRDPGSMRFCTNHWTAHNLRAKLRAQERVANKDLPGLPRGRKISLTPERVKGLESGRSDKHLARLWGFKPASVAESRRILALEKSK